MLHKLIIQLIIIEAMIQYSYHVIFLSIDYFSNLQAIFVVRRLQRPSSRMK